MTTANEVVMTRRRGQLGLPDDSHIAVRPARPDEYDAVIDLVRRRFHPGDQEVAIVEATLRRDPRFRPEHLRVAEVEGALAGMLLFVDQTLRVGIAAIRGAIVAPVAIDRRFEAPSVLSRLMRDALAWATSDGYHLAMLWGHSSFYPRFGYAPGLKRYAVTLGPRLRPVGDMGYTLRAATPADTAAMAACYHQSTGGVTLAGIRSDQPWEWRPWHESHFVEVTVDPVRALRGYFRATWNNERLDVAEIAAMDDGAAQALFDRLLSIARQEPSSPEQRDKPGRPAEVRVNATPDNRWSRWAFLHGATYEIDAGDEHGMVRVLGLRNFFDAIRPELQRRIGLSEYAGKTGGLRLETPLGSLGIAVVDGSVEFGDGRGLPLVTLPWAAFGALMVGYRSAESLVGQSGVRMEGETTMRLLQILFPEGYPHWPTPAYF